MNNRRGTTTTKSTAPNHNRRSQRRQVIHVLPDETALRVVCHASVIGGIIGSNGSVVSKLRRDTGAKIHCETPATANGSEHWVVFIVGSTAVDKSFLLTDRVGDCYSSGEEGEGWVTCDVSAAQTALIRVLERSWAVLAEKDSGGVVEGDDGKEAYCGLLADRSQIGAVMGLGGKNVEWMRRNSGAMIRVLPPPLCGASSDELIQITGDVLAVKKALVMVSTFLQNSPPLNGYPPPLCKAYESSSSSTNGNSEDPHSEFFPDLRSSSSLPNNASEAAAASTSRSPSLGNSFQGGSKDTDKKVVFKIICTSVAAGGIIGKQGTIIRALQNETGASISFGAPLKASGERLVTISARESLESRFSQAQKALVRVFTRSIEIDVGKGLFPGALVKAKLLVPSQFANDLIGNKEATDVDVHISVGGQTLDCVSENEMVIEIMGEYRHVQKALSHVSSKLRENLLPTKDLEDMRAAYENGGANYNLSVSDGEQDVKMVRSGTDDQLMHTEVGNEVNGFTPPSLLENGLTQGLKQLHLSDNGDVSFSPPRSKGVSLRNVTLELAVEKDALAALYGRDGAGLDNLQQISGARVEVKDDDATEVETMVLLSGNPEQTRTAMSLIVSILADH
ncbi:RNA-binding KH domain-containing protein [Raphanus sativus]|uniref:RNA-binding KH domain-containing protein RCF3 n=1 Tax=Raphanus sativus TaxID=3726 RepID=A0A6J0K3Z3_RAPSA|nr:RNA-binding KH domain-containing protein RCF3 [Raphanus sativus]KAJ4890781.1 RNA-binding KH domain-containing protein [Raphanus sativus]